jgi:hypothetical protein
MIVINTNRGRHAVVGFNFVKALLTARHAVIVLTAGDEGSDWMKKPPILPLLGVIDMTASTPMVMDEWLPAVFLMDSVDAVKYDRQLAASVF